MPRDHKYSLLDKTILTLNLVFVRFDAFLNNYVELSFLALFLVLFARFTYVQSIFKSPIQALLVINTLVVSSHYVHSIVYTINDYLDFESVQRLKEERDKYSFYRLRPVIYYNRSIAILLYCVLLHVVFVFLLSIYLTHIVLLISPALVLLAFIHSRNKVFRPITFACLRASKYVLLFLLLYYYSPGMFNSYIFYAFIALVLAFLSYQTATYAKTKTQLWQTSFHQGIRVFVVVSLATSIAVLVLLSRLGVIVPFIEASSITLTPFLAIRQLFKVSTWRAKP